MKRALARGAPIPELDHSATLVHMLHSLIEQNLVLESMYSRVLSSLVDKDEQRVCDNVTDRDVTELLQMAVVLHFM